jgi:L-cystine uptake protein TcyP (sodium:dicarboxylate symporter family)|tara:strand:- start:13 stop:243 length:231 start_codon:yes stop_codon:yes gene_type:complete
MNKIIYTIVLAVTLTLLFKQIRNKSNMPKEMIIPVIVALIVKYVLGDWDSGYSWTVSDIIYWLTIITTSYIIIKKW